MAKKKSEEDGPGRKKFFRNWTFWPFPFPPFGVCYPGGEAEDEGDEGEPSPPFWCFCRLVPQEVGEHLHQAHLELLKAVRAAVDRRIRTVEEHAAKTKARVQKVEVEEENAR